MIQNLTKNTIISNNNKICKKFFCKAFGLMLRKNPFTLTFEFKKEKLVPITMWFVRFPLDLLFVNSNMQIVATRENLKPWQNYFPVEKAKYVIELKKGTLKKSKTKVNDIIKFN